ncbi:hypothetical protein [Streptosporangium lutulentum]|uniref:Integrase n=1 Tax=Streptosporangium lutulentum TaxID=1461250 RepID=A0ABT9QNB4_9ACTN|nr:hypothetical protein [Streptosporangium lutulentum]MDP9847880.1 integrase [Streptosporangium lutulentum]
MSVKGLHFHDLRHTGNTPTAQSGASLADLKARRGHDSDRAALTYQHATRDADQKIADALSRSTFCIIPARAGHNSSPAFGTSSPLAECLPR